MNFEKLWQESTDRDHTEYIFGYWNQDLAHLRKIAINEGFEAELEPPIIQRWFQSLCAWDFSGGNTTG
ncbi:hypothetical protein N7540_011200 [Penicillium herquei]|nr:hypothetical protein N7540_013235 [Penicillium herquei]KAJ6004720.1 hypothetical protein N7540_013089 [Penicillium herquei]KAJ6016609.1 hypothetical protein N7540_011200 [Penicillium herquei]